MKADIFRNMACIYEPDPSASQLFGSLLTLYWPSAGRVDISFYLVIGPFWWAIEGSPSLGLLVLGIGINISASWVVTESMTDDFKETCELYGTCQLSGCPLHASPLSPTAQKLTSAFFLVDSLCPDSRSFIWQDPWLLCGSMTLFCKLRSISYDYWENWVLQLSLKVITTVSGYCENVICHCFFYLVNPTTFWS